MGSRLAFVAVVDEFEGVFLTKGDESAIKISGLGKGEHIRLDVNDSQDSPNPTIFTESGVFPLTGSLGKKFTLKKICDRLTGRGSTTVEILTNGSGPRT